jgi:hypothetical protein
MLPVEFADADVANSSMKVNGQQKPSVAAPDT